MSLYVLGNCIEVMTGFPDKAVAQNLANPPYLISFRAVPGTPLPVTKLTSGLQRDVPRAQKERTDDQFLRLESCRSICGCLEDSGNLPRLRD